MKIYRDLQFLKGDSPSSGNVNMAKSYGRLLSTNIPREKRRESFDPQRVNLLGEHSICMVNLLETKPVIVFLFLLHDGLASVVSTKKFCFVKRA